LAPGESVFIKRGVVHGFTNRTAGARIRLCTLTPGVLGPAYFKEMAALLAGGAPDPAKMEGDHAALRAHSVAASRSAVIVGAYARAATSRAPTAPSRQLMRAIDDFSERAGARKHGLRLRQQFVPRRNPARMQGCQHIGGLMPGRIERLSQAVSSDRVQVPPKWQGQSARIKAARQVAQRRD